MQSSEKLRLNDERKLDDRQKVSGQAIETKLEIWKPMYGHDSFFMAAKTGCYGG